jgi:hypothetical protein
MTKPKTKRRPSDAPDLLSDAPVTTVTLPEAAVAGTTFKIEAGKEAVVIVPPKEETVRERKAVVKLAPPPAPEDGADDLIILARAAANPKVDPAKMQALREIMKDIRQERREEAFTRDFIALQADLPEIDKDGRITINPKETARDQRQQVTPFSTFENIHRVCMPILRGHSFAMWHEVDIGKDGVGVVVRSFLKHTGGHQTTSAIPLVLDTTGSKNNNQGAGSSISYGKRYNTIALLNIISKAPQDMDLDGAAKKDAEQEAANALINGSQAKELLKEINDSGIAPSRFLDKYGIKAAHELPARYFEEAKKALRNYKAQAEKAAAK